MKVRKILTGEDLVNQILDGKMTFRNVRLVNPDLSCTSNYASIAGVTSALYEGAGYGEGIDFSGSDLTGLCAPGIYLRGALFNNAILNDVNFDNSEISYSELRGARIANFSIRNGTFSCLDFEGARINGLDIADTMFFENSLKQAVFFGVNGIKSCQHFSTSEIKDVFVDPVTYNNIKAVFPVHAPLVAQDVLEDMIIDQELTIPAGSFLVNGEYYISAWRKKIGKK